MLAAVSFVFLLVNNGWAQENLLTNPGLESGDFSGRSLTGNSTNFGVNTAGNVITGTNPAFGTTTEIDPGSRLAAAIFRHRLCDQRGRVCNGALTAADSCDKVCAAYAFRRLRIVSF